jgi:hypothetical protein
MDRVFQERPGKQSRSEESEQAKRGGSHANYRTFCGAVRQRWSKPGAGLMVTSGGLLPGCFAGVCLAERF